MPLLASTHMQMDHAMDPNIIVMITMLSLPNGDSGVHIKPFETVAACTKAAEVEQTDPFVAHVQCSALTDGSLDPRVQLHALPSDGRMSDQNDMTL